MLLKRLSFWLPFFITFSGHFAFCQISSPPQPGNWTMLFGQLRFHEKFSFHFEAQHRDYGIFSEQEQILLRGGINFIHSKNAVFTTGYANVTGYPYDRELIQTPSVNEDRLWQQFLMRNNIGRCFFEHRYRFEQRWIRAGGATNYLSRLRYLLRVSVPLNKKEISKNTLFLSFYDEVFIHFASTPFDRNRLYGAIAYQFSPATNVQLGYMAQTVNTTTRSYLQLAVFWNPDIRKKEKE